MFWKESWSFAPAALNGEMVAVPTETAREQKCELMRWGVEGTRGGEKQPPLKRINEIIYLSGVPVVDPCFLAGDRQR